MRKPNGRRGTQLRRWRHKIDDAVRECKAADVPFVIFAIDPHNQNQLHGGYDGPASAIVGIISAVGDSVATHRERVAQRATLYDSKGDPLTVPDEKEEP